MWKWRNQERFISFWKDGRSFFFLSWGLLLVLLLIIDLIPGKEAWVEKMGFILWNVSYLYLMAFGVGCVFELLKSFILKKFLLTTVTLAILFVVLFKYAANPKALNGETPQLMSCTITHVLERNDFGYRNTCFVGYPLRQMYLAIIPSLIWGRSLVALNMGMALYFILGTVIFFSGLLKYYDGNPKADLVSAAILASMFHLHFFVEYLFGYNQGIFPFSLGLIVVGFFLHFLSSNSFLYVAPLGFSLLYLIYAYTPSLAMFFLGIFCLGYFAIGQKDLRKKIALLGMIFLLMESFFSSTKFRTDINIYTPQIRTAGELVLDVKLAFNHLLFQNYDIPIVSPLFSFIFLTGLLFMITFLFGWHGFVVGIWIFLVIVFTVVSKGYVYYPVDLRMSRALVLFPIFWGTVALALKKVVLLDKSGRMLFVVVLLLAVTGIVNAETILSKNTPHPHYPFIDWVKQNVPNNIRGSRINMYLTREASQNNNLLSLGDTLQYFVPGVSLISTNYDCVPANEINGLLVVSEGEACQTEKLEKIGVFTTVEGKNLYVFRR